MINKFTEEEKQFLIENYPSKGARYCATTLDRSISSIHKMVSRTLHLKYKRPAICDDFTLNFIKSNYIDKGTYFCAKSLNISINKVTHIARNLLNLRRDAETWKALSLETRTDNRITIYKPLGDIFNDEKWCYMLGYLWADGSLQKNSNKLAISLIESDMNEIIDVFMSCINWNRYLVKRTKPQHQQQIKLTVSDHRLHKFLQNFDFYTKSTTSPTKILSQMSNETVFYFIRGYLDGDGTIYMSNKNKGCISFYSSFDQDWSFLIDICNSLGIQGFIKKYIVHNGRYSYFRISKISSIATFGKFLYKNFPNDKIGLLRKYNKFIPILEHYNNIS